MNPANVKLRNEIPKPPDVKNILEDILEKTNNIHVAFLFSGIGIKLLQKLARCLCATKNSLMYSGWKELSIQLGLDPLLSKCIENCNVMKQDPVFEMLFSYAQMENATVNKIYQGLHELGRNDVIFQTQASVFEFYEDVKKMYDTSDEKKLLKPPHELVPPVIYKNLEELDCNTKIIEHQQDKVDEIKSKAQPIEKNKLNNGKIVMLTYRTQDANLAQKIANEFRKERNGQRIRVILLQEHANRVYADQERIILKFFARADYIIPILSHDYLSCISEKEIYNSAIDNVDSIYVKYIYNLMTNDYMSDGCKNKKIRCIIPNEKFSQVKRHYAFKNPIFRTWVQSSELEELADKILHNQI